MKKIISSILIAIVVLQLFAPFGVGMGVKNNIEIINNKAEADYGITLSTRVTVTDTSVIVYAIPKYAANLVRTNDERIVSFLFNNEDKLIRPENFEENDGTADVKAMKSYPVGDSEVSHMAVDFVNEEPSLDTTVIYKQEFTGLDHDKDYKVVVTATQDYQTFWTWIKNSPVRNLTLGYYRGPENVSSVSTEPILVKTLPSGQKTEKIVASAANSNGVGTGTLPPCGIDGLALNNGTVVGCIAQGLYYLLFKTTSAVFGLAGKVLDFTLMYSISDSSYRSTFVIEGWGVVRDFCNMFFIFVLLYIAFGTILNIHSVKTKEMIMNVVIIGLLMNFSLFATQVIIDTSNILTRVFYSQETIVVGAEDSTGKIIPSGLGEFGEIKLSEAIISKANPQKLILEAEKVNVYTAKNNPVDEGGTNSKAGSIDAGTFILVILLSTAVNVVGIIVFLSCGIIFITRVIGLWLAMILVPFAFFSYTVPALQNMEMVGWKHWWPETLKLAFLAPVFAFFMYIIVGFMDKGLDIINASDKTGLNFLVAIVVPFVLIMVLLTKAKKIASDMSGEIGKSITNGIKAVGGMALGGAALGGAVLGRKLIGGGLAAASRTEGAKNYGTQKIAFNKKLEEWEANGGQGPKPTWAQHAKDNGVKRNPLTFIGAKLNEKQKLVGDIDYARHEQDELKKAAGAVDSNGQLLDNNKLSGTNIDLMEKNHTKMKLGEAEAAARKGIDAKGNEMLLSGVKGGENAFKAKKRKELTESILANPEDGDVEEETKKVKTITKKLNPNTNTFEDVEEEKEVKTGKKVLTKQGENKLVDKLNLELNAAVKVAVDAKLSKDFTHIMNESSKHVGLGTRSFANVNKNSFDIRKLSDMKTDQREGLGAKSTAFLVAAVATGVRGGIKGVGMSNGTIKVEGDFMKDLGNTISDSLKSMKVNVDLGHVGEHKSSADAHGGDAGGGHH